ncbi:MAG: enoyl-CoA hydratase [Alphaproteobacteria bacterium]
MNQAASDALVLTERDGAVLTITLNRAKARNSLSRALMGALQTALAGAAADPAVKVVILAANGPVFSAGHDLKEMTAARADRETMHGFYGETFAQCSDLMQAIVALPQPVIAQVQGMATAAGCQLVATCDLAVASETARFATPGVNIGLFCSTPMVALSRNVPRKAAMEMLLTGEAIDAATALRIGLVNRVVPAYALEAETRRLAATIAQKSRVVVGIGKKAFYDQVERPLGQAYAMMSEVMTLNMLEADAEEGIGAFVEKRSPRWQDDPEP